MDQSAIQHIQKLAVAASISDKINDTSAPVALVPDGFKLQSLELFMNAPAAHKEVFKTHYLSEFFSYISENDYGLTDILTVFIDEELMEATAIFDRSKRDDPSWQHHKARIALKQTPALQALLDHNTRAMSQDDLIDFAQDWKDHIMFYDGENSLSHNDALSRLRKLKISKSSHVESNRGDFKASASAIEQIAIDAADAPLPSHFVFITEPYLQFDKRDYTAQLRALGEDNKPQLKYRLMGLPAIERDIAQEFKDRIANDLSDAVIHIGTCN